MDIMNKQLNEHKKSAFIFSSSSYNNNISSASVTHSLFYLASAINEMN
jgi:hypothetical protein